MFEASLARGIFGGTGFWQVYGVNEDVEKRSSKKFEEMG